MEGKEFLEFGQASLEFVANYLENIRDRNVLPSVAPAYLHKLLPTEVPEESEHWKDILKDIDRVILPGITHWQSPHFNSYYPTKTSYPSIIGEMITAGIGVVGFSWICSPACTELEVVVMNWLGKFFNLPKEFLNCSEGPGGGIIQGSASEAILVSVLAAREQSVRRIMSERHDLSESEIRSKLIAYSSDQSNVAVEKAGLLAAVEMRLLKSNNNGELCGNCLQQAVLDDIADGKFPISCVATLGTTGTCAYDKLEELGPICKKNNIWLHVDAAYAGAALCCPEYRPLMTGLNWADSLNVNISKWLLVNYDSCAMWFKNSSHVIDSFNIDRIYLKHNYTGETMAPDYRNWQIPLARRFRSLKVWMVLRSMGAKNLREVVRNHIRLAEKLESYIKTDSRFEIAAKQSMGLVCFRLKGDCNLTRQLLEKITERRQVYMIPTTFRGKYVIRYVVSGFKPEPRDIDFAWQEIKGEADNLLNSPELAKVKKNTENVPPFERTNGFSGNLCVDGEDSGHGIAG